MKPLCIAILAYDHMNLLDLSGPLQALCTANRSSGRALYDTVVVSASGGLITTSAGLPVMTQPLSALDGVAVDTVIAAGGCAGDEFYAPPQLAAWVARRAPDVRRVCSVCTGAFVLAAAGQLDGRVAATHWAWTGKLQQLHPRVQVDAERIFVRDGNVWTSAGVSAGIDLALALIEEDYGHRVAITAARQMVVYMKRSGGQSQFSAPLAAQEKSGGRFAELHAWMAAHLHEELTVERLAAQAGMAPRTFARSYGAQMGVTPGKMVETMRLEAARRALEETSLPLKSIAARNGYVDEQNLRRAFQRHLGISPGQYRSRFSPHGA
ncbi:GlxA family transcriptional regulator [Pseudoduganella ginsengisoli]|uniref:Helix-turn-helix domain-containing protein n=1 Tax=Pseudoduganella ginsengisoli TaxID=1462440 RepID=A0A6L6Q9E6_9BURK|nr:GlxA family transcriptional regulator [Pseudoduganella ginsengisoli]MTW05808.1 helix-turn-helix domain-containing protein [Pseudoduganella ginsengisoli]